MPASFLARRRFVFQPVSRKFRYLDKESCAAVIRKNLGFLVGMSDFSVSGAPIFSEDDHRVTFPVGILDSRELNLKLSGLMRPIEPQKEHIIF